MAAVPSGEAPAIALSGVQVELGGRPALGPLDFVIPRGEYVLVVGPSGSGKTTLLRAIAGLAIPKSGRISLEGALASEGKHLLLRPEQRWIGFLFQGGGLWPHLSVSQTIDFVLRCRGIDKSERRTRIAKLIEWVGLTGFQDRLPSTLSGGEGQRLALARALAIEPRILLLDEPLGPVDAQMRESLLDRIASIHERTGCTVLHVTHDPREVAHLATQVVHLDHGSLRADAPRSELESRA